jgi:uncharacterized protein YndB with AHSA1/START domain
VSDARIRQEVRIEAPLEVVHRFFTDPERLTQWWPSRASIDARTREVRLEFDGPNGLDIARGRFVEVSPRRIVFTWGFEGDSELPPHASRVEVTLEPDGSGTLVTLEQYGVPIARRQEHEAGWAYFLSRLAAAAPRNA